jgi:hypothetical protein
MRVKSVLCLTILWGFAPTCLLVGCDNSGNAPPMINVPESTATKAGTVTPLPKEKTKGGGPGSSGNANIPPGGPY